MAPKSPKPSGSSSRSKLPRLTNEKGQLLSKEQLGKNIDNWIDDEFEEELRLTAFLDANVRRQGRLFTGVGDMEQFVKEFNNNFQNTTQLADQQTIERLKSSKPKLKKVNLEAKLRYVPKRQKK